MIIMNQDRDKTIKIHKKLDLRNIVVKMYNGNIIGYNIIVKGCLLGTFDTSIEAFDEICNINNCEYDYYVVSGFKDYLRCF